MNERSNGNGRSGSDGVDGFGEADDETVVVVSDEYTRSALGRLADGLRGAADRCDGFRETGGEAGSEPEALIALEELVDWLRECEMRAAGARRGAARVLGERRARLHNEKNTKGK